ncbi:MAG TPA: DUF1360 domain-containing protein [Nitrolancea sp.]|nr:DUF1360 domain-containing protein [Nitrolancea sp.]
MLSRNVAILENRATKLTLIGVFFTLLGWFSKWSASHNENLEIRPFDLLLVGLSAFRTGHMIAYERVAEPLRAPFTETIPDETGAGETVVAEGTGVRFALGELLSCPICAGTWAAAALVYGLHLAPRPTRVFLTIMGATGVAELLNSTIEALTWLAESERKQSAPYNPTSGNA